MLFSLEILQADYGDCLVLYYGKKTKPLVIVIDGGPKNIYKNFLKPRLMAVKKKLSPAAPLPLSMVMVSHLDEDHVKGILDMTDEMVGKDSGEKQDFDIKNLWVNTFDDVVGNIEIPHISSIAASASAASLDSVPGLKNAERSIAAVIASTGQGRELRNDAKTLVIGMNNPFKPMGSGKSNLVRGDGKGSAIPWDKILKLTVVHPNEDRLKKLQTQWDKDLKKAKAKGDPDIIIASITDPDNSPFNLSSIVCLVQSGKKKILLTGDARSDDIVEGLKKNKILDAKGKLHVDILKMPHHGSVRNADPDFFKTVSADHYVISANGTYDNPDKALLDMFAENVKTGTLHLTNGVGKKNLKKKLDTFLAKMKKNKSKVKINIRKENSPSIMIDLDEKINF